jgi:hypothetical protein
MYTPNQDRNARLSRQDHQRLKLLSATLGVSMRELLAEGIAMLIEQYGVTITELSAEFIAGGGIAKDHPVTV